MIPSTPLAIETHDLQRRFGDFAAVDGVSFSVRRGEIFGMLGPNGCGKTTTIRMLCGVLPPTGGSATVLGLDAVKGADRVKSQIGYMSQRAGIYEDLTPREHLDFYASLYGLEGRARREAIDAYLASSGLASRADTVAAHLPGGLRQRLAFGCATLHRPPLLFLDEPTAGIDPIARREFWDSIHAMAEAGTTLLVTTHFLEDAEYCHSLGLMYRGKLVAHGTPDELKHALGHTLLEVDSPQPHEALDSLSASPEVQEASLYGTMLHVLLKEGVDGEAATTVVRSALERAGLPVASITTAIPSLEDVFVAATSGAAASRAGE
jgi:ABC-2 type transport system ATP-binding protein